MTITFITGANKGLGYETARRLIEQGQSVIIGARDVERGQAAAEALGARFVQIDVTDDDSVARAADDVAANGGRLDVLINNAGILVRPRLPVEQITAADAIELYQTNLFGVVRVTHAFLPLLRRSDHPVVINVTSGLGSFAHTHNPERTEGKLVSPLYTSAKAALTMLTTQYAKGLPDIRFNAADPGHTATDLNGHSGPQTATEGTDAIVTLATEPPEAGSGRVIDRFGVVPW